MAGGRRGPYGGGLVTAQGPLYVPDDPVPNAVVVETAPNWNDCPVDQRKIFEQDGVQYRVCSLEGSLEVGYPLPTPIAAGMLLEYLWPESWGPVPPL